MHGATRRLLAALAGLALLSAPAVAAADAQEVSLHAELGPVLARVKDPRPPDDQEVGLPGEDDVAGGGLALRGTYGVHDHLAIEASLGAVTLPGARHGMPALEQVHDQLGLRATVGATARLGVSTIPTLGAFVGWQRRSTDGYVQELSGGDPVRVDAFHTSVDDLILGVSAGLDIRLGARLVVGVSVRVVRAVPESGPKVDSVELPFHLGTYWYP